MWDGIPKFVFSFVSFQLLSRARNDLKCTFKEDVQSEVSGSIARAAAVVPGMFEGVPGLVVL